MDLYRSPLGRHGGAAGGSGYPYSGGVDPARGPPRGSPRGSGAEADGRRRLSPPHRKGSLDSLLDFYDSSINADIGGEAVAEAGEEEEEGPQVSRRPRDDSPPPARRDSGDQRSPPAWAGPSAQSSSRWVGRTVPPPLNHRRQEGSSPRRPDDGPASAGDYASALRKSTEKLYSGGEGGGGSGDDVGEGCDGDGVAVAARRPLSPGATRARAASKRRQLRRHTIGGTTNLDQIQAALATRPEYGMTGHPPASPGTPGGGGRPSAWDRLQPAGVDPAVAESRDLHAWLEQQRLRRVGSSPALCDLSLARDDFYGDHDREAAWRAGRETPPPPRAVFRTKKTAEASGVKSPTLKHGGRRVLGKSPAPNPPSPTSPQSGTPTSATTPSHNSAFTFESAI